MKKTKKTHPKKTNATVARKKPKAAASQENPKPAKRPTAVFPGRFQPFHNGHHHILKRLLRRYKVIVAIGSADRHDEDNPFTARERKRMIAACFSKEIKGRRLGFAAVHFAPDATWVKALLKAVPRRTFDIVFTNNPRVQKQLRKSGIPYRGGPLIRRQRFEGARIRRWGKGWQKAVPEAVAEFIQSKRKAVA